MFSVVPPGDASAILLPSRGPGERSQIDKNRASKPLVDDSFSHASGFLFSSYSSAELERAFLMFVVGESWWIRMTAGLLAVLEAVLTTHLEANPHIDPTPHNIEAAVSGSAALLIACLWFASRSRAQSPELVKPLVEDPDVLDVNGFSQTSYEPPNQAQWLRRSTVAAAVEWVSFGLFYGSTVLFLAATLMNKQCNTSRGRPTRGTAEDWRNTSVNTTFTLSTNTTPSPTALPPCPPPSVPRPPDAPPCLPPPRPPGGGGGGGGPPPGGGGGPPGGGPPLTSNNSGSNLTNSSTTRDAAVARCTRDFVPEVNAVFYQILYVVFVPIRGPFIVTYLCIFAVVYVVLNSTLDNLSGYRERVYAALVYFVAHAFVVLVWSNLREAQWRKIFELRVLLQRKSRELGNIQCVAEAAAKQRLPSHVVHSLTKDGYYQAEGEAVVFSLGIANISRWMDGRPPSDLVTALHHIHAAWTSAVSPILNASDIRAARVHSFGETMVFVIFFNNSKEKAKNPFSPPSLVDDVDGEEEEVSAQSRVSIANVVWQCALAALNAGDDACHSLAAQMEAEERVTRSELLENEMYRRGAVPRKRLSVVCSLSVGCAKLVLIPKLGTLLADGPAVDECILSLAESMRDPQSSPHAWTSEIFADLVAQLSEARSTVVGQHASSTRDSLSTNCPDAPSAARKSSVVVSSSQMRAEGVSSSPTSTRETSQRRSGSNSSSLLSARLPALHVTETSSNVTSEGPSATATAGSTSASLKAADTSHTVPDCRIKSGRHASWWMLLVGFEDAEMESEHRRRAQQGAQANVVILVGSAMILFSSAVVLICAIFSEWGWGTRSPLPFVFGAAICGLCTILLGVGRRRCSNERGELPQDTCLLWNTVMEAMCWVFAGLMFTASLQAESIYFAVGNGPTPWLLCGYVVAMVRPQWLPTVSYAALGFFLPLSRVLSWKITTGGPFDGVIQLEAIVVACLSVVAVVSSFMTASVQRRLLLGELQLVSKNEEITHATELLLTTLREMVPNHEAKRILDRLVGESLQNSSQNRSPQRNRRIQNHHQVMMKPLRSTVMSTVVEDRVYLLLQVRHHSHRTYHDYQHSAADVLVALQVLNERNAQCNWPTIALAKCAGNIIMLTADDSNEHLDRPTLIIALLVALQHIAGQISSGTAETSATEPRLLSRAWIDMTPMMGAVIGTASPSFELFAHRALAGVALLRDEKTTPLEWGQVAITARAAESIVASTAIAVGPRQLWQLRGIGQVAVHLLH